MCNHLKSAGFSLIELIIVIAIMAIFSSIATFQFNAWVKKNAIEAQIKQMATDINDVRVRALTTKQRHSITLSNYSYTFKVYSSEAWSSNADLLAHGTVIPGGTHTVKYQLKKTVSATASTNYEGTSSDILEIDERGMITSASNATVFLGGAAKSSSAAVNCLTIHTTRVNVGKENDPASGAGVCDDK